MSTPTSRPLWVALTAGPSIWFGHFMAVYLLAEAACAAGRQGPDVLGLSLLSVTIVVSTALAIAVIVVAMVRTVAYRRRQTDVDAHGPGSTHILWIALLLDGLFIIAILFTGLPALVLSPC